jgi:hypothetical protein
MADPHLRARPAPRPLWSGPGQVGSHRLYGQLVEHLAGVEAASARAELALELADRQALEQAVTQLVRECRLAEQLGSGRSTATRYSEGGRR